MAWNDTKGTGDSLTAAEWNTHVTHQEDTSSGHDHDGTDSKKVTGTNVIGMTVSRGIVSDGAGALAAATTTSTEIGYVNGVTSAIQTQLDAKAPTASPTFTGTTIYTPSSDTAITAAGGITVANTIVRVYGNGGAIDITANPQIAAGTDGQIAIIQGTHDTNTVTLDDGTGLALSAQCVLAAQDSITLMYDSGDSEWIEISRTTVT